MHWIIQSNLFHEAAVTELIGLLERYDIPFDSVKVVPFDGGIEPDIAVSGPAVVVGSVSLARHAKRQGWKPGAWLGRQSEDDFNYDRSIRAFGSEMLTADARVVPVRRPAGA